MKKKILILMLVMAIALVCSIKETFAYSTTEAQEEVSEPVTRDIASGLRPISIVNIKFQENQDIYFGGEELELVEKWFNENYSTLNNVEIPIFQYSEHFIWGITYNPTTKTLTSYSVNPNDPFGNEGDVTPLFCINGQAKDGYLLNIKSKEYVRLSINYVSSDDYCHLGMIIDETYDFEEVRTLLFDCFQVPVANPEIIHQTNNYFEGNIYSFSKISKTLHKGNSISNFIPVIGEIDNNPTKLYIQNEINIPEDYTSTSQTIVVELYLYSEDLSFIDTISSVNGSFGLYNANYLINRYDEIGKINAELLLDSKLFEYYGAKYFSINTTLTYKTSEGATRRSDFDNVYVNYITSNHGRAVQLLSLNLEPNKTSMTNEISWKSSTSECSDGYINIKVRNDKSLNDVLKTIVATNTDGEKITITAHSQNETEFWEVGKKYTYILKADNDGVVDFVTLDVEIIDSIAPEIYGSNEYTVGTNATMNVNTIKNSLVVVDNVDENVSLELVSDYYTSNAQKPGTYTVTFRATDSAGNYSEILITINVVDKENPVFYNNYGQPVTSMNVYKSLDSVFVLKEITDLITAKDSIDGIIQMNVAKDTYTGHGDIKGNYSVVLLARDKAGNNAYFTINIIVTDKMPSKTMLIDGRIFIVEKSVKITKEDIREVMKMCSLINNETTSYLKVDTVAYEQNYNIPGEYAVGYEIETTSGEYDEGAYVVRVVESRSEGSFTETPEEKPGIIKRFFKWLWDLIVSLFDWIIGLFK